MPKNKTIRYHFRHILMSVTLLWALVLNGQEVTAYGAMAPSATPAHVKNCSEQEQKAVIKQVVSLEATTSFVTLNLQHALEPAPVIGFAAPVDELLPLYATTIPGSTFVALLFPVTIQPQAP
jgi:hypothetical protein